MHPAIAASLLEKLATLPQETVALTPEDYEGCGLKAVRRLVARDENGSKIPIFVYVNRLELMAHIQFAFNLHRKGTSVLRIREGK